uniref:Enkurin domain-containing protein n=1 Tax=Pyrodinium bahamense TaxID=73915 RepID=A0A7R9ZZ63_9DINO
MAGSAVAPDAEAAAAQPAAAPARPAPAAKTIAVATGEVRAYVKRSGFGRGPPYLQDIIGILEDEQEYIEALPSLDAVVEESGGKRPVRLLTDAEKSGLLQGLGAKRDQMAKCFEADLELHEEEAWKRRVRERYLPEIEQIDKDIAQMNQKYIFVASDG